MISVIISTYNRPESLKKAIESVQNQTFKDWELIVVDDASTIDMSQTFNALKLDNKFRQYILDKNFGNDTKPKNKGIREAKGEYIAFLDDDNTWRPDHLQALYNAIKDDSKTDAVYGDRWIIDESKQTKDGIGVYYEFKASLLLQRNYIDTSDVLVRRASLFAVGGFDERFSKYVDWNLWLRMAKAGKVFKHVPLVLTDYYLHKDMKSTKNITENEKRFQGWFGQFKNLPDWKLIERNDPFDFGSFDLEINLPYLGEVKPPKVAIMSLTYDRLEYTKKSFASLWDKAGYDFEHFIFDNGSKDGTVEWLQKYEKEHPGKVHIIYSEDNKGISIASNRLVDEITRRNEFDIVMKSDNDCLYTVKNFLTKMVEVWQVNHRIAMSCYVNGLRDNPGGAPRIGYGKIKGQLIGMTKHLGGICHFVDIDAFKFFRWDTHDFLHGLQDVEFSRYLLMNGFQMGYLENFYCEHVEGTEGQHTKFPEYFEKRKVEKTQRYETT